MYWLYRIQIPDAANAGSGFIVMPPWYRKPRFEVTLLLRPGGSVVFGLPRVSESGKREGRGSSETALQSVKQRVKTTTSVAALTASTGTGHLADPEAHRTHPQVPEGRPAGDKTMIEILHTDTYRDRPALSASPIFVCTAVAGLILFTLWFLGTKAYHFTESSDGGIPRLLHPCDRRAGHHRLGPNETARVEGKPETVSAPW